MSDLDKDKRYIHEVLNKLKIDDEEKFMSAVANVIFENNKELKTWKKIAENLADEIQSIDNGICESLYATNKCQYTGTKDQIKCIPCIIDWARKEVENE